MVLISVNCVLDTITTKYYNLAQQINGKRQDELFWIGLHYTTITLLHIDKTLTFHTIKASI